ncbi:MAG TPA: citrate/2-methylcitrate synthase, partial [Stellaceae bacterium]|nr:citrate/2-methylcitrate synthase [Stellaceae bacterium]
MTSAIEGLEGVVAAETVLSQVDGERGELIIRGLPLEVLARRGFEGAATLLWDGFVAAEPGAPPLARRLASAREPAHDVITRWLSAARGRSIAEGVRLALATLPDSASAVEIAAALPVALAALLRARQGLAPVAPDPRSSTAADFLRMLRGTAASEA